MHLVWPRARTEQWYKIQKSQQDLRRFKNRLFMYPLPSYHHHCPCHRYLLSDFLCLTEGTVDQCPWQGSFGFKELSSSNHKGVYYRKSASSTARPQANWKASREWTLLLWGHIISYFRRIVPSLQTTFYSHWPLTVVHMASPEIEGSIPKSRWTLNLGDYCQLSPGLLVEIP